MSNRQKQARWIAQGAVIAALYVVMTVVLAPLSFGAVQVRYAEMLAVLPMFTPAAVPGLFLGCLLGNILGGAVIWDTIFGSLATLIGAALGYLLRRRRWLVPLPTVIANAVIVPFVLRYAYHVTLPLPLLMLSVAAGEILSCYLLGEILITLLQKRALFPKQKD